MKSTTKAFKVLLLPALLLSKYVTGTNVLNVNLNDAFLVKRGGEQIGGCDGKTDELQIMFDEVANMASDAFNSLAYAQYRNEDVIRRNAYAFLGVVMSPDGRDVKTVDDQKKLLYAQDIFKAVIQELKNVYTEDPQNQPYLYCHSKFLVYKQPNDLFLNANGGVYKYPDGRTTTTKEWFKNKYPGIGATPQTQFAYWDMDQKGYLIKEEPPNHYRKTYCANAGHYGWTIEATEPDNPDHGLLWGRSHNDVVICPRVFSDTKKRDSIDVNKQPNSVLLTSMEPKSLTWLHEMFHVAYGFERTQDQKKILPKVDRQKRPIQGWPQSPDTWTKESLAVGNGQEAQWLGIYAANFPPQDIFDLEAKRPYENPENLAWFGLSNYLWKKTGQDWSTLKPDTGTLPKALLQARDKMLGKLNNTSVSFGG